MALFVIDVYLGILDWLFLLYIQRLNCLALYYGWFMIGITLFHDLKLNYNLVVCGKPNLIELCYYCYSL